MVPRHPRFLVSLCMLAFVFTFFAWTGGTAFAASKMSLNTKSPQIEGNIKPHASGGGCDPFGSSSWSGDIVASACISYGWPYLYPDGYATIKPTSPVSFCNVAIRLYDSSGNYLAGQNYSCVSGRQVHYGPIAYFTLSGTYYSCIDINMDYYNGTGSGAISCSYYVYV